MPRRLWKWQIALYSLILLLLWWSFRQIDIARLYGILARITLVQIALLAALNGLFVLLSGVRWWLLLKHQRCDVSLTATIAHRLAGFAMSYFTPGPQFGGEPLQVYLLRKHNGIPNELATATIVVDRLVDLLVNFAFLLLGCIYISIWQLPHSAIVLIALPLSLFTATAVLMVLYCLGYRPLSKILAQQRWRKAQKIQRFIQSSESQIATVATPSVLLSAFAISIALWLIALVEFWATFHFLGHSLSFVHLVTLLTTTRLALLAPIPGGMGAIESSQVFALQTLMLPPTLGLGASVLIRVRDISLSVVGFLWMHYVLRT